MLVAALWLLGTLAVLIGTMAVYARATSGVIDVELDRLRAETQIEAGLELAAYRFADADDTMPGRGTFTIEATGARTSVTYLGETARVDINFAPPELLKALFTSLGTRPEEADTYAQWIVGFRTPQQQQDAAGAPKVRSVPPPLPPRHGPFADLLELQLVGIPGDLVTRALPFLTASSGVPSIDARIAAPELLAALPDMTAERVRSIVAARGADKPDSKRIEDALGKSKSFTVEGKGRSLRVQLRTELADGFATAAEAVILRFSDDTLPYRVLSWEGRLPSGRRTASGSADVR